MDNAPMRKPNRLKDYDYSLGGAYFVTICTEDRKQLFGTIRRGELCSPIPYLQPSPIGKIVNTEIARLSQIYDAVYVDCYVVMPNHVHMVVVIRNENGRAQLAPTISRVVQQWKGSITKQAGRSIWQKSFHDHIIRNEADYLRIREYIENNPYKWEDDKYFVGASCARPLSGKE